VIMFKRLPEELSLVYVFKDRPAARAVGRIGDRILSLSLIYLFHLLKQFAVKQCTFLLIKNNAQKLHDFVKRTDAEETIKGCLLSP